MTSHTVNTKGNRGALLSVAARDAVRAISGVADERRRDELFRKYSQFFLAAFSLLSGGDNVAQYISVSAKIYAEELADWLAASAEEGYCSPPLALHAQRSVLACIAGAVPRKRTATPVKQEKKKEKKPSPPPQQRTRTTAQVPVKESPHERAILAFLQRAGVSRVRDVVAGCPSVSERTVKRQLKMMTRRGIITRYSEGTSVSYAAGALAEKKTF